MKYNLRKKGAIFLTIVMLLLTIMPKDIAIAEGDYISITTADQLLDLADTSWGNQEEAFSKNYKLENDIDMTGKEFKGIGKDNATRKFSGIFDGNGHKITNLNNFTGKGFFNYVDTNGVIKNLNFENCTANFTKSDCGIVAGDSKGTIENVYVKDCILETNSNTQGLIAGVNEGTIKNTSVHNSTLTYTREELGTTHGGIVGRNKKNSIVENVFFNGTINAQKWAGGIVGWNYGKINNAYTTGTLKGTEEFGGIVGRSDEGSTVSNSIANIKTPNGKPAIGAYNWGGGTQTDVYYNSENYEGEVQSFEGVTGKTSEELKALNLTGWTKAEDKNDGYPYPTGTVPLENSEEPTASLKANLWVVNYDNSEFKFQPILLDNKEITFEAEDFVYNILVNNEITFQSENGPYGEYITSMYNIEAPSPDGWMYYINDKVATLGVSTQTLKDKDEVVFYYGSPLNNYTGPTVKDLKGEYTEYTNENLEGKGTPTNPFLIKTTDDLNEIMKNPEAAYRLENNLDLSDIDFEPIGSKENHFKGKLDGNNKTISNLKINKTGNDINTGLFAALSGAKIKKLNIQNADVKGGKNLGILAGYSEEPTQVTGCKVSGNVTSLYKGLDKQGSIGGLIGHNNGNQNDSYKYSVISNCEADVNVKSEEKDCGDIGGLVGKNDGLIEGCKSSGTVEGGVIAGGLVGNNSHQINNSVSTADVKGDFTLGGFVGLSHFSGKITNSLSTGTVIPKDTSHTENVGGFAGSASGKLENNMSASKVLKGWSWNGGFIGSYDGAAKDLVNNESLDKDIFGDDLKAIGSAVDPISELAEKSNEIKTDEAVLKNDIKEEFGIDITTSNEKALAELEKYEDTALIEKEVEANTDITDKVIKLKTGSIADSNAIVEFSQSEYKGYISDSVPKGKITLIEQNTEGEAKTEKINLLIIIDGQYASKEITVTIEPQVYITNVTLEPNTAEIIVGDEFDLPTTGTATMSDTTTKEVSITWDKTPDVNTVGTQTFTGTVEGWTGGSVTFTLKVSAAPVKKTALKEAIKTAEDEPQVATSEDGKDVPKDQKWTTEDELNAFKDAIKAAKGVYENVDATQDEVNQAVGALKDAIEAYKTAQKYGLNEEKPTPSKEKLRELIKEGEAIDPKDYTEDSYKVLEDALNAAKDVKKNPNATEEEIKKAEDDIKDAIKNLALKPASVERFEIKIINGYANKKVAEPGEKIVINTNLNEFSHWSGNVEFENTKERETSFIMPAYNVRIIAREYTKSSTPSDGYYPPFLIWGTDESSATEKPKKPIIETITLVNKFTIGSKTYFQEIDGLKTEVEMDVKAYIKNDRTMVPLRYIGEALGYKVSWDNYTRTAILKNKDKEVRVPIDNNKFYVNDVEYEFDASPEIVNDRTMLSISNIAKALDLEEGVDILWDQEKQEATIIVELEVKK